MGNHLIPRLFVTDRLAADQNLILDQDRAHYLTHVLRLNTGSPVRFFNGQDGEWLGKISSIAKRSLEIGLTEQLRIQETEPDLWLYCAPIKKAHFDYMIEKATELGVTAIHPTLTARTQIRDVNIDRCRSIAIESAEQSERLNIPHIHSALVLKKCIEQWPSDRTPIICAEWGDAHIAHDVFTSLPILQSVGIFVGPEGGFAAEELEMLRNLPNAQFIRLGSRILRADTAAIAALSCWQALCGDWRRKPRA